MDALKKSLEPHRAAVWGGLGAVLCLRGGCLRYTSLFFPLLRASNAEDIDKILSHTVQSVSSALASPPSSVHPMLWRTAQALAAQVLQRVLHMQAALEVTCSGAVACGALWIADVPAGFLAVGGLYPAIRAVRVKASSTVRRQAGYRMSQILMIFDRSASSLQGGYIAGQQLATLLELSVAARCDWYVAIAINTCFGIELLQRAWREALEFKSPDCSMSICFAGMLDVSCFGFGLWGLVRQLKEFGWQRKVFQHIYSKLHIHTDGQELVPIESDHSAQQ